MEIKSLCPKIVFYSSKELYIEACPLDQLSHFLTQDHCLLVLVNDLVARWLACTQAHSATKPRFTWLNWHQTNEQGAAFFKPCPIIMASNWLRRLLTLSNHSPPAKKKTNFILWHSYYQRRQHGNVIFNIPENKKNYWLKVSWLEITYFFQTKQQFKTIYLYRKETKQNTSGWLPLHNCWSWNHSKTVSKFTNQTTS